MAAAGKGIGMALPLPTDETGGAIVEDNEQSQVQERVKAADDKQAQRHKLAALKVSRAI